MRQPRSRLAQHRKAAGYSQEALADEVGVDRSTVARWEAGQNAPQPWLRPKLARALRLSPANLTDLLSVGPSRTSRPTTDASRRTGTPDRPLAGLRRAMLVGSSGASNDSADSASLAVEAHRRYQRADYETARRLASLVVSRGVANANAYLVVAKLSTKLGDQGLALLAADRAVNLAREANQPAITAAANYQIACALFGDGRTDDAELVAWKAAEELAPTPAHRTREARSVMGLLYLLLVLISARRGEGRAAREHLSQADQLADQLGRDENWLWTGFGPTNVRIHELGALVELGETRHALQLGSTIDSDRLPVVLQGRRCQVHLELARAAAAGDR